MDPDHGPGAAEPDANAEESTVRALLQSASTITFDGALSADAPDLKCHACSASESPGGEIRLRRCSGCSIALYCSEKCQKKAWSGHKLHCRLTSATKRDHRAIAKYAQARNSLAPIPITNDISDVPIAGAASFAKFSSMHGWALRMMCLASLHLSHDGRGADHFRHTPSVIRFQVYPTGKIADLPVRDKPWNAWQIHCYFSSTVQEVLAAGGPLAEGWQETLAIHAEAVEKERAQLGDRYVGSLLALFDVDTTNMTVSRQYPIATLRDPDALQDPRARDVLRDLLTLCMGYINLGIPLQQYSVDDLVAYPARMIQDGRDWRWKPLGTKEKPFDDLWRVIFEADATYPLTSGGRKTDLHPLELMAFASRLW
ncbi:hypothetical protein C8Q76DRAFT_425259 [Earliella scabrosa]|nr:hypothetical protein C8Q76DRAFT_425259 [Earliella scabrosa]